MCFTAWGVLTFAARTEVAGLLGLGYYTYAALFTFNHPWEHPWDFLDGTFVFLFVLLTIRDPTTSRTRVALLLIVFLAALNRESAAFAGVIWFSVHWGRGSIANVKSPEALFSGALTLVGYGTAVAAREVLSSEPAHVQLLGHDFVAHLQQQWEALQATIANPQPFSWLVLMVCAHIPAFVLLVRRPPSLDSTAGQLLLADAGIVLLTLLWANVNELRTFIPHFAVLACALTSALAHRKWCET
jgi:hypothetical protein